MSSFRRIGFISLLMLIVVGLVVSACAPPAAPVVSPTPPPPKVFKWRVQSFYPGGAPYATLVSKYLCDTMRELSGGRLDVTPYGSGALVPFGETVEAVSKGTIEGAIWWPAYETGRSMAAAFFGGAFPFGLRGMELFAWVTQYGGLELMEELYGQWNIKPIGPMTIGPTQIFLHLKAPAYSLEELKGRILRLAAMEAEVMKEFGVETILLPAAEIYTAAERGVIDGLEYASPADNWRLGFHEVGKYIVLPGWHSQSCPVFLLINMDVWNELPDDLKYIVEVATHETFTHQHSFEIVDAARALKKMEEYGCEFIRLSDKDLATLDEAGRRLLDKYATKDPFFAKVMKSIDEFKELMKRLVTLEDITYEK